MTAKFLEGSDIFDLGYECVKKDFPYLSLTDYTVLWNEYMEKKDFIVETLKELAKVAGSKKDQWRKKAYSNAAYKIKKLDYPLVSGSQAMRLEGVGKGIGKKIDEMLRTGALALLDQMTEDEIKRSKTIQMFKDIWGVGVVKAIALFEKGYTSIEEIPKEELNAQQRIGVKYYADFKKRIPRSQIQAYEKELKKVLSDVTFLIAGSYRRKLPTSGDIDILVTGVEIKEVVERLQKAGMLTKEKLSQGPTIFMGVAKTDSLGGVARRVDIHYSPKYEWGTSVLYFTGSGEFNVDMRVLARKLGYKLSEKELLNLNTYERVDTPTEESVFKALGLEYIEPEKRTRL